MRDLEDRILCPRAMAAYAFFAITFFSDIIFLKFHSTKRRTKRLKSCEKKIVHHARLGENNLFLIWPTYPQGSDCTRARARANDARNYAQYVMRNAILRNHLNKVCISPRKILNENRLKQHGKMHQDLVIVFQMTQCI